MPHIFTRNGLMGCALALSAATALATMPSTLRSLSDSYRALRTGLSVNAAIELMGNPKTRHDSTLLGVSTVDLSWVDIAQVRYQARFVGDWLIHKSAAAVE